jgi:hypothetical protein
MGLDGRAGVMFFAFLMIAGSKWNLNPTALMPSQLAAAWTAFAAWGWYVLAAFAAFFFGRPYYEQWLDDRHARLSAASANEPSRVGVLEQERARVRAEQQARHAERTAAALEAAELRRRKKVLESNDSKKSKARGDDYNPMNPGASASNSRYEPSAPGGDCGPSG